MSSVSTGARADQVEAAETYSLSEGPGKQSRHLHVKTNLEKRLRRSFYLLLWCSLIEPTPCVPRRSLWQQFSPPRKDCHGIRLAGSGTLRAPLPAREKPWQFLRGGENCCHGDRLGTQGVGSTSEHHNNTFLTNIQVASSFGAVRVF